MNTLIAVDPYTEQLAQHLKEQAPILAQMAQDIEALKKRVEVLEQATRTEG